MTELPADIAAMRARDNAAHALGLELLSVGPDTARLGLIVAAQHLNSHAICHGGVLFTLADCAFAYAANADTSGAVAQANNITYLVPAKPGDRLTAEAHLTTRAGRSAIYDVTIRTADGTIVALLRAQARFVTPQDR